MIHQSHAKLEQDRVQGVDKNFTKKEITLQLLYPLVHWPHHPTYCFSGISKMCMDHQEDSNEQSKEQTAGAQQRYSTNA
jgi:hypothetical protein